jgi:deazaflavin-dependent oxidoreductase (nitroreductase family)
MVRTEQGDRPGVARRYQRLLEPRALEAMRRGFNLMNKGMVPLWRLGLGRMLNSWPQGAGQMLVLEHVGRRSGAEYRTPVDFSRVGDDLYCVAAFGEKTHWYRNILAAREFAVWLPDGRWLASADDASDDHRRLDLMRQVLIDSGFAARLIGLDPGRMSDEDLDRATASYRLLRIHPLRREASSDGPGSLAWVWALGLIAVLVLVIGRRRWRRMRRD